MISFSIGKYEIIKLKARKKEIMNELKMVANPTQSKGIFPFSVLKLQSELQQIQTKLKLMGDIDSDNIA